MPTPALNELYDEARAIESRLRLAARRVQSNWRGPVAARVLEDVLAVVAEADHIAASIETLRSDLTRIHSGSASGVGH